MDENQQAFERLRNQAADLLSGDRPDVHAVDRWTAAAEGLLEDVYGRDHSHCRNFRRARDSSPSLLTEPGLAYFDRLKAAAPVFEAAKDAYRPATTAGTGSAPNPMDPAHARLLELAERGRAVIAGEFHPFEKTDYESWNQAARAAIDKACGSGSEFAEDFATKSKRTLLPVIGKPIDYAAALKPALGVLQAAAESYSGPDDISAQEAKTPGGSAIEHLVATLILRGDELTLSLLGRLLMSLPFKALSIVVASYFAVFWAGVAARAPIDFVTEALFNPAPEAGVEHGDQPPESPTATRKEARDE